jgi:hypothetical protein
MVEETIPQEVANLLPPKSSTFSGKLPAETVCSSMVCPLTPSNVEVRPTTANAIDAAIGVLYLYFVELCVLVFWPHSIWTKSLMCKDVVNRDSTFQSIFKRLCTAKKIKYFRFPVSRPDDASSRPDINLSTALSVRTTCYPVRTPDRQASSVRTMCFSVRTLHCIEKLLF